MDDTEIEEFFASLGPVAIRRMFGGKGIYHAGQIVAVVVRGELLLKGDAISGPQYEAAGSRRWSYEGRRGKPVNMPYWSVPVDAFDDPDLIARWVRPANETADRATSDSGERPSAGR
jgi:DNA transformation protein and related proteins